MTIMIHSFRTQQGECGHLFSATGDTPALHRAARAVGLRRSHFQSDGRLDHYDVWGAPLWRAKAKFPRAGSGLVGSLIRARRTQEAGVA